MASNDWRDGAGLAGTNDADWAYVRAFSVPNSVSRGRIVLFIHRLSKRQYRVAIRDVIAVPIYKLEDGPDHKKITTYVKQDFKRLDDALKAAYSLALVMGLEITISEQYIGRYIV